MKIYIVMGDTGEYSDRSEWLVKAFVSEDAAKELVVNATTRANEIAATTSEFSEERRRAKNEFDPQMRMDYTGTSYRYETVELETP